MKMVFYILATIFVVFGIFAIVFAYTRIIKDVRKTKKASVVRYDVKSALKTIDKKENATAVAQGFISLLQNSYILVHLLINAGNQYNDQVQSELFANSLTDDVLESLNSLEGKYV